jgi:hypothetical protein
VDAGGRRIVLVSGAPGAGKTQLAGPLAAELGFALLGKDRIKETVAARGSVRLAGPSGAGKLFTPGRRVGLMIEQLFVRVSLLAVLRGSAGPSGAAPAHCQWLRVASVLT